MIILLFCWLVGLVCGTGRPDGLSHLGPRTSILQTPSVSEIVYLPDILQTSPVSEIVYLPDIQTHRPISEFIEVPDVGGFDPKEFDVLISDVGVTQLKHEIADAAGIPYHLPATEEEANTVVKIGDCFIYGRNLHTMFPAVVKRSGKAFWVVFLIDTGAPTSYLSAETSDLLGISASREDAPIRVRIAGRQHSVFRAPRYSHISTINILGADFLSFNEASLVYDTEGEEAKLFFDGIAWRVLVDGERL